MIRLFLPKSSNQPLPMNTQDTLTLADEITAIELIPGTELESINATDAALTQLYEKAQQIATSGTITDRADYDEAHRVTMIAVKVRTESSKVAKKIAAPYGEKYDAIIAAGKSIGDRARQAEDLTRPLKEAYETAETDRKAAELRAEKEKIDQRIWSLIDLGFVKKEHDYVLGEVTIDSVEVHAAPDSQWETLYAMAKAAFDAQTERRLQQEAEQLAEQQRLQQQREEQDAMQAKLDDERKELRAAVLSVRTDKLTGLGFSRTGNKLTYPDYSVTFQADTLSVLTGEESEDCVADFNAWKAEQEKQRLENERKNQAWAEKLQRDNELSETRRTQLKMVNWSLVDGIWQYEGYQSRIPDSGLVSWQDDAVFQSVLADFCDWQAEQVRLREEAIVNEKAKLKADKEREKRLKADKELLGRFLKSVLDTAMPTMPQQPETHAFLSVCWGKLSIVVDELRHELDAL